MRALVLSLGPTSILSVAAALRHIGHVSSVDVFACLPSCGALDTVNTMAKALPGFGTLSAMTEEQATKLHAVPRFFSHNRLRSFAAPLLRARAVKKFRSLFSGKTYDVILYVHDVISARILSLAALAWPEAQRICIGDGFGIFYAREQVYKLLGIENSSHPVLEDFHAHTWMGILPMDYTCGCIPQAPLTIIPKQHFEEALTAFRSAIPMLDASLATFMAPYAGRPKALLITENHAETGCIDFDTEIRMYRHMVLEHTPPDCVIYIKSHPGESLPKNTALINSMKNERICIALPDALRFFPVELFDSLIQMCDTIVCCSYPRLTLAWLYGKSAINPMADKAFIHNWFPERVWRSYEDAILSYEEPLRLLYDWDGKGMLWTREAG